MDTTRRPDLKNLTNEQVKHWLDERRASWKLAIDNNGIDGNIGSIVRGHNAFAGGGITVIGSKKFNKRSSVGTYIYEPIKYVDSIDEIHEPLISVESDPFLPPLQMHENGCYLINHDGLNLNPEHADKVAVRYGPPAGWNEFTSSGFLAHIVMSRMRATEARTGDFKPFPDTDIVNRVEGAKNGLYEGFPFWLDGWTEMNRNQQREQQPITWWIDRLRFDKLRDWYLWIPDPKFMINIGLAYRLASASSLQGIITPRTDYPLPNCKTLDTSQVIDFSKSKNLPIYGLELGGENVYKGLPEKGILMLGNEQSGISGYEHLLDNTFEIPQQGSGQSMNVIMAASVAADNMPFNFALNTDNLLSHVCF